MAIWPKCSVYPVCELCIGRNNIISVVLLISMRVMTTENFKLERSVTKGNKR